MSDPFLVALADEFAKPLGPDQRVLDAFFPTPCPASCCATTERCTVSDNCRFLALLPDPDYSCGAAYCDDPACNTHGKAEA